MSQKNIGNLILPVLLVPLGVVLMFNLLSGGGNQLGNTFFMLLIAGAGFGFFAPKAGLLLFVIVQFYMDFMKRLLILGDGLSSQDVMTSLGLGPIIIVSACVACTIKSLTGKVPFFNMRDMTFFLGCVCVSLLGVALTEGNIDDLATVGQSVLGTAMLGMTAYATYVLLRDPEDARRCLKFMVLGAIPMGLYTFYQSVFGISQWEESYILTGLSKVLYNFYLTDGGIDYMRPFSTLNTHTSVGAISGVLFLIAAMILAKSKVLFHTRKGDKIFYFLVALLFLGSCIISKNRTTYLIPIAGLFLAYMFASGWRTVIFYLSSVTLFVWIVIQADSLNSQILDWTVQFESTAFGRQFGTLGTYQDRLRSFMLLSRVEYWSPFGLDENDRPGSHDQVTDLLMKVGYVPLGIIVIVLCLTICWWHRNALRIRDDSDRRLMILLTSVIVPLGICGVAYGSLLFVAPVNSVLGLLLGLGMAILARSRDRQFNKIAVSETVSPANTAPILQSKEPRLP